jgi:O-antigen ligase
MATSSPASSSRLRVALVVLAVGAAAVVLAAAPFKTFDLDRYFVPKELVLHVCAALVVLLCAAGARRCSLTLVDALLAAFLVSSLVSAVLATNYWLAQRALSISISGVVLFWAASMLRRAGMARPLLVALATGVVLGAATSLAQAYGVQTEYFSLNRAPGGTFGNRNFVAHLAAIGTPIVVLVALTARRGVGSLLGGIGMGALAAVLVMSRSRAAWLAVIVLAIPVGGLAFLTRARWSEPRTARRLVVLGISAALGAIAAVVLPNRLEWKSDSPYLESAAGIVNYKKGSGAGRLVQWTNSLKMMQSDPLFGVGPGNWPVAYPKVASRNDPSLSADDGMTSNPWPSSDWVAYLSERGAIGFGLLLVAMLGILARAVKELRAGTGRDPERVLTAIALVGTLAATAVVGAFDAVLLIAVPTFFFWTLAGALSPPADGKMTVGTRMPLITIAAIAFCGLAVIRGAMEVVAMAAFNGTTRLSSMQTAATLDPGSYRIRVRLAQAYLGRGDCTHARAEARAARGLFPNASEPKRILNACGSR